MCCCLFTASNSQSVSKAAISSLQHAQTSFSRIELDQESAVMTVHLGWTASDDYSNKVVQSELFQDQRGHQWSNLSCCCSLMSDVWLGYFLRSHDKAWTHQRILFNLRLSHVLHLDNMAAAAASTLLLPHHEFILCSELLSQDCVGFLRGIEGEPQSGEAEKPSLQTDEREEVYKSMGPLEHCLRRYHELIKFTWDVKFLLPHK